MLSKEVCINCINKNRKRFVGLQYEKEEAFLWNNVLDEERWNDGEVMCPIQFTLTFGKTKEPPDNDCPYKLEHILRNENDK
jgi:hypothetical protein